MIDTKEAIVEQLDSRGCFFLDTGCQFIGTSGLHLDGYVNIDPALTDIGFKRQLGAELADPFRYEGVDTVLSAATGGIVLGEYTGQALSDAAGGRPISAIWADKTPEGLVVERNGFAPAIADSEILIAEDVVMSGFTVKQLIQEVEELGGRVVGVSAVVVVSGFDPETLDVPFQAITEVDYSGWSPENCELDGPCSEIGAHPIVTNRSLGHGAQLQEKDPHHEATFIELPLTDQTV